MITYLIGLIVTIPLIAFSAFYFGSRAGRKKEQTESLKEIVKEALDVKKDNEIRRNDDISVVDKRLLKHARKED